MMTSTFRSNQIGKAEKVMARGYAEIMQEHDDLELGLRRISHYCKRANKRATVYRNGRRNGLYSK